MGDQIEVCVALNISDSFEIIKIQIVHIISVIRLIINHPVGNLGHLLPSLVHRPIPDRLDLLYKVVFENITSKEFVATKST